MTHTTKMVLSCIGVFIGGTGSYWQLHDNPGVLITTATFWISFVMAGMIPLGSYLLGLASKAPWESTTPPPTGGKP